MPKALVVPASTDDPVRVIEVNDDNPSAMQEAVGGWSPARRA